MRKFALLLGAVLFVSAPLIAATPSVTYAAAKKKAPAKAPKAASKGDGGESGGAGTDIDEVNSRFWRAINDLGVSLSKPAVWPAGSDEGAGTEGGAPKAGKSKGGKKSRT